MKRIRVAKSNEFSELEPIFVDIDGSVAAIYKFRNNYFAYADQCPHQSGPVCEGIVIGNNEAEIFAGGHVREYTSGDNMNIVCPWHGVEFDLENGVCRADPRYRLRTFQVIVEGDEISIQA